MSRDQLHTRTVAPSLDLAWLALVQCSASSEPRPFPQSAPRSPQQQQRIAAAAHSMPSAHVPM